MVSIPFHPLHYSFPEMKMKEFRAKCENSHEMKWKKPERKKKKSFIIIEDNQTNPGSSSMTYDTMYNLQTHTAYIHSKFGFGWFHFFFFFRLQKLELKYENFHVLFQMQINLDVITLMKSKKKLTQSIWNIIGLK